MPIKKENVAAFIGAALVIGLLVVAAFNWRPEVKEDPSKLTDLHWADITPAKITEPFKTWYVGDVAVDVPASMGQPTNLIMEIFPTPGQRDVSITFKEKSSGDVSLDSGLTSSAPIYRSAGTFYNWKITAHKTQNLQTDQGQAVGLSLFYGPGTTKNSEEKWALGLDARIKTEFEVLEFAYTEILLEPLTPEQLEPFFAQKQTEFLAWIKNFRQTYSRTGHNQKPGMNQLATRFGLIEADEKLKASNIEIRANFKAEFPGGKILISLDRQSLVALCHSGQKKLSNDFIFNLTDSDQLAFIPLWAVPVDSPLDGSLCFIVNTMAEAKSDDLAAQSHIAGVVNAVVESIRPAN